MGNFNGGIIGIYNTTSKGALLTVATASQPFTANPATTSISYLVVGGGGTGTPGGDEQSGGGGAGGYLSGTSPVTGGSPYPITVGGGGSSSAWNSITAAAGGNGAPITPLAGYLTYALQCMIYEICFMGYVR